MNATCSPSPFPSTGYQIRVNGGTPPYTYVPRPAPPNPPGVSVSASGWVTVDPQPSSGTPVAIDVYDSGTPQQTALAANTAA